MYLEDKPLQYLLDSVQPTTTSGGVRKPIDTKTAYGIAKKDPIVGKQAIEVKKDPSAYTVSKNEKDVVRFDPKQVITDSAISKEKEIIPGIPNMVTYIGGGIIGLSIIYMLMRD